MTMRKLIERLEETTMRGLADLLMNMQTVSTYDGIRLFAAQDNAGPYAVMTPTLYTLIGHENQSVAQANSAAQIAAFEAAKAAQVLVSELVLEAGGKRLEVATKVVNLAREILRHSNYRGIGLKELEDVLRRKLSKDQP